MARKSYHEGWGYSDTIKLVVKGEPKDASVFYKEFKKTFPKEQITKSGKEVVEVYVYEREIPLVKKMAKIFDLKVVYGGGGGTGGQEIARTILMQLGGQGRLVVMTGAYNFIALKNGVSFKIKNRKVNYIKIELNGKDLYDMTFGKIYGTNFKILKEYNDIFNDQLIPLFEKETGMYLKLFKKGGITSSQNRDMVLSQLKSIHHHETELRHSIKTSKDVEAWVLAKIQRATTDLADVTHYIDGKTEYATGGTLNEDQMLNELLFETGGTTPEFVDLFEDYENIPDNVQKILDKYSDSFEDGDYEGLTQAHNELDKIGYTFEFYLDGEAYALRPKNVPLNKVKGFEEFALGGTLLALGIGALGYKLYSDAQKNKRAKLSLENYYRDSKNYNFKPRKKEVDPDDMFQRQEARSSRSLKNKFALGGISVADANPYIASAKAVQGIAPESVSALDRKMASRINPDPNRPVFFAIGGRVGDYVQFRGMDDEIKTGVITEDLGNDKYAVSHNFGQALVDSSNYIGKSEKPTERKRFLGIFKEGGEIYKHKHSPNWGEYIEIELIEPTKNGWKVNQTTMKGRRKTTKIAYFSESEIQELFEKI